ncbi:MAG: globin family protein [Akkermansiaceae bacterium]|jgi:methyl-accepting chemotaxis protein
MISLFKNLFGKADVPKPTEPKKEKTMTADHPADHPLTLAQKTLVQESWEKVKPISETAAGLFYGKLFELDPELKRLFKDSDMKEQGKKLMLMIGAAVKGLDTLGELVPAVQKLGARHIGYGVKASHYDTVGVALLDTLEKGLADDFTPEAKEAWTITYTTLAGVMIEASNYEEA